MKGLGRGGVTVKGSYLTLTINQECSDKLIRKIYHHQFFFGYNFTKNFPHKDQTSLRTNCPKYAFLLSLAFNLPVNKLNLLRVVFMKFGVKISNIALAKYI